jgi:hypothetical protein
VGDTPFGQPAWAGGIPAANRYGFRSFFPKADCQESRLYGQKKRVNEGCKNGSLPAVFRPDHHDSFMVMAAMWEIPRVGVSCLSA